MVSAAPTLVGTTQEMNNTNESFPDLKRNGSKPEDANDPLKILSFMAFMEREEFRLFIQLWSMSSTPEILDQAESRKDEYKNNVNSWSCKR